jgi:catechol 2,3-dioxygenase-like lactoylglutathione lyase family enzyme
VDAFWQAGIDAGYRHDGAPGPRTQYRPDYYGAFLLDPDGNSAEAVHGERANPVPDGRIDHLWIRVADLAASKRFYTTIAPHAGIRLGDDQPGRVQFTGQDYSFSLIDDERPLTASLLASPQYSTVVDRSLPTVQPRGRSATGPSLGSSLPGPVHERDCTAPRRRLAARPWNPRSRRLSSNRPSPGVAAGRLAQRSPTRSCVFRPSTSARSDEPALRRNAGGRRRE